MRGPFENRTFRRLFAGRVITNLGDSLYFIGAMWLVYSLTGDPFYTGVAGFLTMGPSAFQFLAGPVVDRYSIRRLLVGTQLFQAVVVSTIPITHALGSLTVWHVLVVMPVLAAANQIVYPAQTAALPRILDDGELVAANSAFSVAYQGFDMVANGIGGVIIGLAGAVALFAVDAVTFGLAAIVFATLAIPPARGEAEAESVAAAADGRPEPAAAADGPIGSAATDGGSARDADEAASTEPIPDGSDDGDAVAEPDTYLERLAEGAAVLRGTFLVPLVASAAVVNVAAGMMMAAIPPYADGLGVPPALSAVGAAGAYGILMAAFAGGNFLGALCASAIDDRPFGRTVIVGFAACGLLWSAAIAADWLPLTALLFVLASVPIGVVNVQIAAIVQSAPPEALVGRVSSILGSASASMIPVGALAGGIVASALGPRVAVATLGIAALGLAGYTAINARLRTLPAPAETSLDVDAETAVG